METNSFLLPKNNSMEFLSDDQPNTTMAEYQNSTFKGKDELILEFIQNHPVELWKSFGLYDVSFLETVNSHWLQFEGASPEVHYLLAALYFVIMFIGCGANFTVIMLFVRSKFLRIAPNYLIMNLAVAEFFLLAKMPIFIINSLYFGPVTGALGCKIYGFVGGLTGTASIMTLTAISVDRFFVILFPLNQHLTSSSRALLLIGLVWLYAFTFSSLPLFGLNGYVSEGYLTSCSFDYLSKQLEDQIFVFVFFIAAWFLPLTIIVFCYRRIYLKVKKAEQFGNNNNGDVNRQSFRNRSDNKKFDTDVKVAVVSCSIVIIWGCAWTPYAIVALMGIFGQEAYLTPLVSALPALFCKTASAIDPFVYTISHPKFKEAFKNTFGFCPIDWFNCKERNDQSENLQNCNFTINEDVNGEPHRTSCNPQPVGLPGAGAGGETNPYPGSYRARARSENVVNANTIRERKGLKDGYRLASVEVTIETVLERDEEEITSQSSENINCVSGERLFAYNPENNFSFIDDESEGAGLVGASDYRIVQTHTTKRIYPQRDSSEKIFDNSSKVVACCLSPITLTPILLITSDSDHQVARTSKKPDLKRKSQKNNGLLSIKEEKEEHVPIFQKDVAGKETLL